MTGPTSLYRPSLGLLTDLYQLTMAYGYHKSGVGDHQATFHLNFRQNPFAGGYTLTAGLAYVIDWLAHFGFDRTDLEYLAELEGNDGRPLFDAAFLEYLKAMRFTCDVRAMPEGTPAFPYEPLLRVTGPIIQAQLLETPLLNMINFQSLIATKAARVCQSTGGDPVLEFGLRRAQGIDGALAASRAAFIGGCAATSNVLAGRLFGIPVRGTHAHSWVMCFDSEPDAFEAYARALPNNCVFLVDTYDTLQGVRRAIAAGQKLREQGHKLVGIRLDSGDLAYLSGQARKMLDQAGFTGAVILASNDLDEHIIASLKQQGACIGLWGVGTKLVTGHDQPAIGGVYKMSAIRRPGGPWQNKIKLSEQVLKVSNPGIQQVRRYRDGNRFVGDAIYDEHRGLIDGCTIVDPLDMTRRKTLETGLAHDDLLVPIFDRGRCVYDPPSLPSIRQRVGEQLACLDETVKRFVHPHQYPAGLEESLFNSKTELIMSARRENM